MKSMATTMRIERFNLAISLRVCIFQESGSDRQAQTHCYVVVKVKTHQVESQSLSVGTVPMPEESKATRI